MTDTQIIDYTPSQILAADFPEFSKITIYGTQEDPLFPVRQVQKFLGSDQIRLDRGGYKQDRDYVKLKCRGKDGKSYEQNLLTERGFQRVALRSDTEIGEKLMDFVYIVLKELRLHGHVTLENAMAKTREYQEQLAKKDKLLAARDHQLEATHGEMIKYKRDSEKFYHQKMDMQTKLLATQVELERKTDNYSAEYQLEKIKENTMKKVYVYMVKPPKAIVDQFPDYDTDSEPTTDDEICFEVSFRTRDMDACGEFHVYRHITMERLHQKLHERDFSIMIGESGKEKEHKSVFRGSLDRIRYTIDELI